MNIGKKIINASLWGEKPKVTDDIVAHFRKEPKELDLIIDKEYFHSKFIWFFFILGISATLLSRILKFLFENTSAYFINDIVLDIFSELGIAVFGGAITAYILEKLKHKTYLDNVKLRNEIIERIKELEKNN